jgi:hypothetical protein
MAEREVPDPGPTEREADPHRGHVYRFRVGSRYAAICSCDWVGAVRETREQAWVDHDEHRGCAEAMDELVRETERLGLYEWQRNHPSLVKARAEANARKYGVPLGTEPR